MAPTPQTRLAKQAVVFAVMIGLAIGGCGVGFLVANHAKELTSVVVYSWIVEVLLGIVGVIGLIVTGIRAIFETRSSNQIAPPPPPSPPLKPPPGPRVDQP